MKPIDWILLAVVAALVVLALSRFLHRGGGCGCGGGCDGRCPGCGAGCPGRRKARGRSFRP